MRGRGYGIIGSEVNTKLIEEATGEIGALGFHVIGGTAIEARKGLIRRTSPSGRIVLTKKLLVVVPNQTHRNEEEKHIAEKRIHRGEDGLSHSDKRVGLHRDRIAGKHLIDINDIEFATGKRLIPVRGSVEKRTGISRFAGLKENLFMLCIVFCSFRLAG